jgi:uncharacterized FlaG/YvyC family protein
VGETSARFEVDPVARRVVLKVLDDRTGEVIRQVPPEESLAVAKVLEQLIQAEGEHREAGPPS